jgi:hypothetical protein
LNDVNIQNSSSSRDLTTTPAVDEACQAAVASAFPSVELVESTSSAAEQQFQTTASENEEIRMKTMAREQEVERLRLAIEENELVKAGRRLKEESERKMASFFVFQINI